MTFKGKTLVALSCNSRWASYFLKRINDVQKFDYGTIESDSAGFDSSVPGNIEIISDVELMLKARASDIVFIDFSDSKYFNYHNKYRYSKLGEYIDFSDVYTRYDWTMMYELPSVARSYIEENKNKLALLKNKFSDDVSLKTYDAFLEARLTGSRTSLIEVKSTPDNEYFGLYLDSELAVPSGLNFVDVGAYRGETSYKFLACCGFEFASITAFEPDKINYQYLRHLKQLDPKRIKTYPYAVGSQNGEISFSHDGTTGSNSNIGSGDKVKLVRLDDLIEACDFIKIDVEGVELEVLKGAAGILKAQQPKLAIACYHYSKDLLEIIEFIESLNLGYQFKLRHYTSYIGDTCLYAEAK